MSINSSLVKLANKIDTDGASTVVPEYKNPNNSVEKSLERIADNYEASGGGGTGGGVLVVTENTQTHTLDKTWNEIKNAPLSIIKADTELGTIISFISMIQPAEPPFGYGLVAFNYDGENIIPLFYEAESADGYPVRQEG